MDYGTKERAFQEVLCKHPAPFWFNLPLNLILFLLDKFIHAIVIAYTIFVFYIWCSRQQKWGLNTYLYAPKDDYKHRMFWREMYSVEEAGEIYIIIFFIFFSCFLKGTGRYALFGLSLLI